MKLTDDATPFLNKTVFYISWFGNALLDRKLQGKQILSYTSKRIHIDGIISFRSIIEKRVIMATDMHVGFKVQLVVEFYIYFFVAGSQPDTKKLPTPQQVPRPLAQQYRLCLRLWASSHWQKQQTFFFCAFFLTSENSIWHQVYSFFFPWLKNGVQ